MLNIKLPLEKIILHLWNKEIQNSKFNFILYKINEYLQKKTVKIKYDKMKNEKWLLYMYFPRDENHIKRRANKIKAPKKDMKDTGKNV